MESGGLTRRLARAGPPCRQSGHAPLPPARATAAPGAFPGTDVMPGVLVDISHRGLTTGGVMRHSRFVRLRVDLVPAKDKHCSKNFRSSSNGLRAKFLAAALAVLFVLRLDLIHKDDLPQRLLLHLLSRGADDAKQEQVRVEFVLR